MSNDSSNNGPSADMPRQRRASISSNPMASLFQRSGSTAGTQVFPGSMTSAGMNDQRRRLSISTIGLTGTSPGTMQTPFGLRRGSISTNASDSIDENAVDDEELPYNARTAPSTPFVRRMSFGGQAMRNLRAPGTSPGGSNDQGFNWSEQLRSRAESIAAGTSRPAGLSTSPPRGNSVSGPIPIPAARQDRAGSVADMAAPPVQTPRPRPQKPDAFQERILKGDFYMD